MKLSHRLSIILVLFLSTTFVGGWDIYVALDGTNNPPFTNWPGAATNIQWAVDVGVNGDTVWISNGVYVLTNQVTVISNITISGISTNDRRAPNSNQPSIRLKRLEKTA